MRALHWFRADLRLRDNTALAAAAARADEIGLVFVFDDVLLASAGAPRLGFMLASLEQLARKLEGRGHSLLIRRGDPAEALGRLVRETRAELVTMNRDPGPYASRRDARVRQEVERAGARVLTCKDRVLFEASELRTGSGTGFEVYSAYRRAWRARLQRERPVPGANLRLPRPLPKLRQGVMPRPSTLGLGRDSTELPTAGEEAARRRLSRFLDGPIGAYAHQRDLPAVDGTSRLSPYLRLGVLSSRVCVEAVLDVAAQEPRQAQGAEKWLDELVWREFYSAILEEHPHVLRRSFRPEYDAIHWDDDPEHFEAWCAGRTGYPFVDAAMRQLAREGWMHNRARMVVASFLTKDLLIDWRRGERFFLERLVDGDPASNNGGWQWAASTGTDAQPYFRIFNPVAQGERFDPDGAYVRRYVPELESVPDRFVHRPWEAPEPPPDYPSQVVDHARQRLEALERYKRARAGASR